MRSARSSSAFLNSHQLLPSETLVMQSAIRLVLPCRGHLIIGRGESGSEMGVPGKFSEGDPDLEHSNECDCDNGGVCPICYQR